MGERPRPLATMYVRRRRADAAGENLVDVYGIKHARLAASLSIRDAEAEAIRSRWAAEIEASRAK